MRTATRGVSSELQICWNHAPLCYNAEFVADEKHSRRYFVSGMVQAVGFRMFVLREAQQLGVTGYTRNLFDGRVEVLACGTAEQLEKLKLALQRGPRMSSVSGVREEEARLEAGHKHEFVIEQDG